MIAIISDIHGNYPALRAVLDEIERLGCKTIISLGDVAGYYCQINECIDLLREKNIQNIMGNHDYYMAYNMPCPRSKSANDLLDFQRHQIRADNLEWIKGSYRKIEQGRISFVHGGWNDPLDEYLTDVDEEYFENRDFTYFFSGHTHVQVLKRFSQKWYCNPGSVGQPRDNDPRSAFALFDGKQVYLKRIYYNIDDIAREMDKFGLNKYYYEGLYTGVRIGASSISLEKDKE